MQKFLLLLLLSPFYVIAQVNIYNPIQKAADGLYFMYYDSSNAKSTIVEFADFIAMIEVPIKDEGGSATNLQDHSAGAETVIRSVEKYFPSKPLKYLIHSHWHPHSISSVKPFLEKGINLVSTKANFEKVREFVDSSTIIRYQRQLQFVEGDSLIIQDSKNKVVAYRFSRATFPNTPTPDYLYFYFPKYNFLHCGCMYNKWEGEPVEGKEILTGRMEDLNHFLASKNIQPSYFIRLNKERQEVNDMQPYANFKHIINNGVRASDIAKRYFSLDEKTLHDKRDSLVETIIRNHIPASIFNSGTYAALRIKALNKALQLAKIQVMVAPHDANVWDTLGEVYYFLGEYELAKAYQKQSQLISPDFTSGGENVWKKNLEEHQRLWANHK